MIKTRYVIILECQIYLNDLQCESDDSDTMLEKTDNINKKKKVKNRVFYQYDIIIEAEEAIKIYR